MRRRLEESWGRPRTFGGWLASTSHADIGRRYIVTAIVFFALAGLLAIAMRLQLARPENGLLGPDAYNQIFTLHGTTMMFLFAVPVMNGFALALVPLLVGTRNVAFPRLNAFGYWVYVLAGALLWGCYLLGMAPDAGWFSYVPLAGPEFSPGKRVDVWAQLISLTEISALVAAVEIIVTVFKMRAPGMSLDRVPLFVWSMLVMSFMIVFAMPAVMLSSVFLAMDRLVGTHFFNVAEGGDVLLWQHLFWFFGHPEVYIIFIPALGFVSSIVAVFARRQVFGYPAMVLSLVATGFISFGLWVHHMFATDLPQLGESFFTAASMLIAIPSGVQIFCWIATLWGGRPVLRVPLLYVLGFVTIFVAGGMTGVMLASVPLDLQVHDSAFVTAHFHYVLIGGAVFPLFGAIAFWFPKMTGRLLSESLGRWTFGLLFVGFNLTFFPLHQLGLDGMPRRIYTYLPDTGWTGLNQLATVGSWVIGVAVVLFVVNAVRSLVRGPFAGADPWRADTLEWATDSPPPAFNFLHLPVVVAREGLWAPGAGRLWVAGLDAPGKREVLVTNLLDAEPEIKSELPGSSLWPLAAAVSTVATFAGAMFTPWAVLWGSLPIFLALFGWGKPELEKKRRGETAPGPAAEPEAAG
ncbi:MAG TPA: cytochrome c oxidase subunit I [Thermoanaerobaculia bacterium]|nr:cytochrome c oxidase subunit I [Thermoanaerobaculia bacterium]